MEDDKLSIKVNIADRYYPLKIERDEEEKIRLAAKRINEKILQYKSKYNDKDIQDFLAMAALQFVTKLVEQEENNSVDTLYDKIEALSGEINELITD
jgi:cell division protein ZapA (FtsZ GTPase activity inhibitor)